MKSVTQHIDRTPRKKDRVIRTENDGKTYKVTPIKYDTFPDGQIKYPVYIGANLKILDFGKIDTRP